MVIVRLTIATITMLLAMLRWSLMATAIALRIVGAIVMAAAIVTRSLMRAASAARA